MSIETLIESSHDERARGLLGLSIKDRESFVSQLLPGHLSVMRDRMTPTDVAKHVNEFPKNARIGPFGEALPEDCTQSPRTGFGTYLSTRNECVDCPVCLICFCRATGKYFSEMEHGVDTERDRIEDVAIRSAKEISGQRSRKDQAFLFYSDIYACSAEKGRYSCDRALHPDGSLDIDVFSEQVTGGVRGLFKFFTGPSGAYLLRSPFPLRIDDRSKGFNGIAYRFKKIQGEENKMRIADYFEHLKANGDDDRQAIFAVFFGFYGMQLPNGWRLCFDKKITEHPAYVWAEYTYVQSNEDTAAMVEMSQRAIR